MYRPFVIGVAGGSGSGKSTLVNRLVCSPVGDRISVLPHDAYYLNRADMPLPLQLVGNWDHPDAIDNSLFILHLDSLIRGQSIQRPSYDFTTHARSSKSVFVESRPVLVAEGILLLAIPEVRSRLDLAVFVDTPAEERLLRRMLRDINERGRTTADVADQFRSTVRPMHDQFVEPSRHHAHVVIPWDWNHNPEPSLELLLARIQQVDQRS